MHKLLHVCVHEQKQRIKVYADFYVFYFIELIDSYNTIICSVLYRIYSVKCIFGSVT